MKMKPPLLKFTKGTSKHHKNGASVKELEKIANVLIGKGDYFDEKPNHVTSTQSTDAVISTEAEQSVALNLNDELNEPRKDQSIQEYTPSTPVVKSELESKTLWNKKTVNEVIDVTGSSSPSQSLEVHFSSKTSSTEPINLTIDSPKKAKGSSSSTKSSIQETEIIDLCASSDESVVEQEEPSAFDDEEDHNVYDAIICLPKLLDCSNLSIPDPTSFSSLEQNNESKEEIGVMVAALPYPEDDPKSSSDYAKTPPIQPFDTTAMTPPLPRESYDNLTTSEEWDNSFKPSEASSIHKAISSPMKNSTPLLALEQERKADKCCSILPSLPDTEGDTIVSGTLNPDLQIPSYKKDAIPSNNPSHEQKDGESQTSASEERPMHTDGPSAVSRKRVMSVDAEERPGKSKRAKVSENHQQYDIRFIIVESVKKCIQEVNSKLDKSRFKILCRTVSKRLLGSWSSRKQPRQKSVERWLKHRHIKIVRLVEKYLEKNLI